MDKRICLGAATAALLLASVGSAQTFTNIVSLSPTDLSADGTKLYGYNLNFSSVTVYDIASGTTTDIGGGGPARCSADGSTACGQVAATGNGGYWDGSIWTDIGTLDTLELSGPFFNSTPKDMSSDGSVLVGSDYANWGGLDAFVWETATNGPIFALPKLGAGSAYADCVSGDGRTVGGWETSAGSVSQAAVWKKDPILGWLPPTLVLAGIDFGDGDLSGAGTVRVISESGMHAAIESHSNLAPHVRLWQSPSTVTDLGPVLGYEGYRPIPTGVTTDGKMVVGTVPHSPPFGPGTGFIWTESGGMQAAASFLSAAGVPLPVGFTVYSVDGCSADGKVIWGFAGSIGAWTTWLVELPAWNKYGVGVSPTNSLDLSASGSTSLSGGALTLTTTGVGTAPFAVTVVARQAANYAALGGVVLVNPVTPSLPLPIFISVASGGASIATLTMPSSPSLAGLAFHVQSASPDAAMPVGWALSNGLRAVLCP